MKILRTLPITIIAIFFSAISYGQTWGDADYFTYDAAGNRIVRDFIYTIISPKPGTTQEEKVDTLYLKFNVENLGIKAYPNPTTDVLIIENQNWKTENKVMVTIIDIAGRLIQSRSFTQAKETIPFKSLIPGTYSVNYFLNDKLLANWKIIKN